MKSDKNYFAGQGLEVGADDYIIKPFDFTELNARLGTGVRMLEMHGQLAAAREELRFSGFS